MESFFLKKGVQMNLKNRPRVIDIENKLVVVKGVEGKEIYWEMD